jgi:N-acetylneuraminic acid mutarotase
MNTVVIGDKCWAGDIAINSGPSGRYGHKCILYKHEMFLFGGYKEKERLDDTYAFNLETLKWREIKVQGPGARDSHSAVLYKHYMVIFGGSDGFSWFNDIYAFDFNREIWTKWESHGDIPPGR